MESFNSADILLSTLFVHCFICACFSISFFCQEALEIVAYLVHSDVFCIPEYKQIIRLVVFVNQKKSIDCFYIGVAG